MTIGRIFSYLSHPMPSKAAKTTQTCSFWDLALNSFRGFLVFFKLVKSSAGQGRAGQHKGPEPAARAQGLKLGLYLEAHTLPLF